MVCDCNGVLCSTVAREILVMFECHSIAIRKYMYMCMCMCVCADSLIVLVVCSKY